MLCLHKTVGLGRMSSLTPMGIKLEARSGQSERHFLASAWNGSEHSARLGRRVGLDALISITLLPCSSSGLWS